MKKYYIFSINRDFYEAYKKNSEVLYRTLDNLFNLSMTDASYGISVFNQVCNPINKEIVQSHFNRKDSIFRLDLDSLLEINPSCMVLATREAIPLNFLTLNYYEAPLFMIDFKNKDYFWLCLEKTKNF